MPDFLPRKSIWFLRAQNAGIAVLFVLGALRDVFDIAHVIAGVMTGAVA